MSLAENLLNTLPNDGENTARIANPSEEPHIIIDENRNIIVPQQLRNIAVTGDKDVETVTFDCVRYWDGHDLSNFAIYLNYTLPVLVDGKKQTGTYIPTEIRRFDNYYSFDWTIDENLTSADGQIEISLVAVRTDEDGYKETQWGSFPNHELTVTKGLPISNVPSIEEKQDILSQIIGELNSKIDADSLVQTTGNSETAVMSQKAVTGVTEAIANDTSDFVNTGKLSLYENESAWAVGTILAGVYNPDIKYRVALKDIQTTALPLKLSIGIGFRIGVFYFVDGVFTSQTETWQTREYTIPANSQYMLVITRTEEDVSETADITLFKSQIRVISILDGKDTLSAKDFINGTVNHADGLLYAQYKYRISTPRIHTNKEDISLQAKIGFQFGVFYYDSEGKFLRVNNNLTNYTIPANSYFRILVRKITENNQEIADIGEFFDGLVFNSNLGCEIDEIFNHYGKEIDVNLNQYAENDRYTVKVKPSELTTAVRIEKSEDVNSGDFRTIGFVDFTGKIGFYIPTSDNGEYVHYVRKDTSFNFVANHEYHISLIKLANTYMTLEVVDAYTLEKDSVTEKTSNVGRGWGHGKYQYLGNAPQSDVVGTSMYVLQNVDSRTLIIGDSFVEGISLVGSGARGSDKFASLIKKAVKGDCAINGRGGANAYVVWEWLNSYLFNIYSPKYVVLCVGTNDSDFSMWKGRMSAMISLIEDQNAEPILMTVCANTSVSSAVFNDMNEWIKSSGYRYIDANRVMSLNYDTLTNNPALKLEDGVHPNVEGNKIIFERAKLDIPELFY